MTHNTLIPDPHFPTFRELVMRVSPLATGTWQDPDQAMQGGCGGGAAAARGRCTGRAWGEPQGCVGGSWGASRAICLL